MLDFIVPFLVVLFLLVAAWRVWFVVNGWLQERISYIRGKKK